MSKELEALKILKANAILFDDGTDFGASMLEAITVLDKALTPPTADDVCEALSEYLGSSVYYLDKSFWVESPFGINKNYPITEFNEGQLRLIDIELPPHLITLIGRFYEGLEKGEVK